MYIKFFKNTTALKYIFSYRWPINTFKDDGHHSLLEKCKSKLQWGITSHESEWLASKKSTNNAGECKEKREPFCTVAGNVNWDCHYGKQCEGLF